MYLKKMLFVVVGAAMLCSGALSVAAQEETGERVIQVAIPNEDGILQYYTGDKAQEIYDQLEKIEEVPDTIAPEDESFQVYDSENIISPKGAFRYKYRFVKTASGSVYGSRERITPYLKNSTSVTQSMSVSANKSIGWSIDASLSGGYKTAFNAAVGASWQNTATISCELTVNVAPKKRTWLEFSPRYRYVCGKAQKYYVTRGPIKTTVVEESKAVYSKSPKKIKVNINGKTTDGPDGIYIWKEDNKYK